MRRSLWFHKNFQRFWIGQTISTLGTEVTLLALPTVAILTLHATPLEVGILQSLQMIAFLFLGPIVGVLADRLPRRRIMIVADIGRFIAIGSVPAFMLLGWGTMLYLDATALLVSICTVFFDVSSQAYVPTLVEPPDLVQANAKSYLGDGIGRVIGPFLGGLLIQSIGAALSLFTDAISYLVSIVCLLSIRGSEHKRLEHNPTTTPHFMQTLPKELRAGFGVVFQHPVLRIIVTVNTLQCLGGGMAEGVVLIFAYRNLSLTPAEVGIAMAIGSVGFVIGALLAVPMTRRIGIGPMLLIFGIISSSAYLLVPLGLFVLPIVFVSLWRLCFALSIPMYDVNQLSLRQALTSDHLRGRMNATFRSLSWGALGIGPLIGGYLATIWGIVPTIVLGSVIGILASLLLLVPSIATLKGHPDSLASQ